MYWYARCPDWALILADLLGVGAHLDPSSPDPPVTAFRKDAAPTLGVALDRGHAGIREQLRTQFGEAADRIRIQYGGSVNAESISGLMDQPDVDGALVGGASLDPASFWAIIGFESLG